MHSNNTYLWLKSIIMKKYLLLLVPMIFLTCSGDDDGDGSCTCNGEFQLVSNPGNTFFADGVDCDTGEPILSNQNSGGETTTFYLGCAD